MKESLIVVAVIVVAAVVAFASLRQPPANHEPNDDDVIEQLRLAGSDLSKPHPLDFYIYIPSKEAAERIASELSNQSFQVQVRPAASGSGWLALASKEVVPTSSSLAKLRHDLTLLAKREQGDYDGWEAAIVK